MCTGTLILLYDPAIQFSSLLQLSTPALQSGRLLCFRSQLYDPALQSCYLLQFSTVSNILLHLSSQAQCSNSLLRLSYPSRRTGSLLPLFDPSLRSCSTILLSVQGCRKLFESGGAQGRSPWWVTGVGGVAPGSRGVGAQPPAGSRGGAPGGG